MLGVRIMADIKPQLAEEAVRALLAERFLAPEGPLAPVGGGQVAQTFAFTAAGRDYIIRFNHDNMLVNFEKEAYVYQRFASPQVPIPPILQVGRLDDLVYAISQKMPGRPMTALPPVELAACLPALIETLDAIHAHDIGDRPGYGIFDGQGIGRFPSWPRFLQMINEEEEPGNFFGQWHHMFDDTFLERPVFDQIYAAMIGLLDYCPPERSLVHGDFGFSNVLVADGRITAVLDWIAARYGDFLYDIAWLDFWAAGAHLSDRFARHYAAQGRAVPHYAERLLCYHCYIGLSALLFFAKTGDQPAYTFVRDRVLARLARET